MTLEMTLAYNYTMLHVRALLKESVVPWEDGPLSNTIEATSLRCPQIYLHLDDVVSTTKLATVCGLFLRPHTPCH